MTLLKLVAIVAHPFKLLFFYYFQVSVNNTYPKGQKLMGRTNRRLGKLLPGLPEDLRFCGYFGVSVKVAVVAWEMMDETIASPLAPSFFFFCGHLRS
jgi:hypothetical protein